MRDYTQMNELQRRLGPRGLVVLGFPCNQFGHQVRRAGRGGGGGAGGRGALPCGRRRSLLPGARSPSPARSRLGSGPGRVGPDGPGRVSHPKAPLCGPLVPLEAPAPSAPLPQENAKNEEILNLLKHVRPGGGFEPNFTLFEKCEVNGAQAHPLFVFLREALPAPSDDATALMTDPKFVTWSPVCRNDVSWNFEKFLVGPDGVPVRRYSRRFPTIDIEPDIEALLAQVSGSA